MIILMASLLVCDVYSQKNQMRRPVDSIGFATEAWQMDSVMARINRQFGRQISQALLQKKITGKSIWKMAICPHDDYAYAGWIYSLALKNIKAPTVILLGVAHSLEAIIPFLQYYNPGVEIVPILIPAMSPEKKEGLAGSLARAISRVMDTDDLEWMRDFAFVISSDAVHYGCEDWGGQDLAPYGCDREGYATSIDHPLLPVEDLGMGVTAPANQKHWVGYVAVGYR